MKRQDHDKILQEAYYGTGGIPKPEPGAVSVGNTRRRNEQNFFQRLFCPRRVVRKDKKVKKPGFFANLFGGPKFKRRKGKGIDGF
ncbi:MAG TPA: hypothetical protein P5530_03050 [Candidatus Diapherotrites archaeon]|jgi:hypothetical protein|nr:hypothetical protein [Candidatus Diapherotrites archaeon]